jgi:2-(1,2-epoxy-1,2-dihydrophenyl)acetyl-CoA isomerase
MVTVAVNFQQSDKVGFVTLSQPEKLNPLNDEMWADLDSLTGRIEHEPLRSVVLTGAGRVFSAGGDINRMQMVLISGQSQKAFRDSELARLRHISTILLRWLRMPIIRVAAINRCAVGAGLALACSADYRIVSEDGFFDTAFGRLGLPGDTGISYFLPRLVGAHRGRDWLIRPRRIYAAEALRIGLVDEVVPAAELLAHAEAVAAEFAAESPEAIGWIRRLLDPAGDLELERALELEAQATVDCKTSAFHREAVAAFVARHEREAAARSADPD